MARYQAEHDKCIKDRENERNQMARNLFPQSINNGGKSALLYGAPAGAIMGWRAGVHAGRATGPLGQVITPPAFALGGASAGAGGTFLMDSGRNYIQGLFLI